MSDETDWTSPRGHVVVSRRWKYAPPPWVLFEAVVNDLRRWMYPLTDRVEPIVENRRKPDRVVLGPWDDSSVTAVELQIDPDGQGSAMTVLAYADVPVLDDEARRRVRHRLGTIFGAGLRDWVDEPHW